MDDLTTAKEESPRVLKVLEALKQASHDLQADPRPKSNDSAIKALLELETESETILSKDPNLTTLSQHLTDLKSLVETVQNSKGHSFRKFLARRVSTHSISRVAVSIQSEIQAWIDRESIVNLVRVLNEPEGNEDELVTLLTQFENRVCEGFNHELQDLVLKSKVFALLEGILVDENRTFHCCSMRLREHCAYAIAGLIKFNKDVFVGQVLFGPTVSALVAMGSLHSVKVLCSLIRSIKSALVDEIGTNGQLPKIISFLDIQDLQMRVIALDCLLEIGYFGRKEAIEAMLNEGLVRKLVELQRSEFGGDLIDLGMQQEESEIKEGNADSLVIEAKKENRQSKYLESHPFASCVARFAVQLEVGEGLRKREKRAFKQDVLVRVREACVSDAQAATIIAEVLWGASP